MQQKIFEKVLTPWRDFLVSMAFHTQTIPCAIEDSGVQGFSPT